MRKKQDKAIGKIVIGAILIVIAIYLFITMTGFTGRFIGGAILAILGIAAIIKGILRLKK